MRQFNLHSYPTPILSLALTCLAEYITSRLSQTQPLRIQSTNRGGYTCLQRLYDHIYTCTTTTIHTVWMTESGCQTEFLHILSSSLDQSVWPPDPSIGELQSSSSTGPRLTSSNRPCGSMYDRFSQVYTSPTQIRLAGSTAVCMPKISRPRMSSPAGKVET